MEGRDQAETSANQEISKIARKLPEIRRERILIGLLREATNILIFMFCPLKGEETFLSFR